MIFQSKVTEEDEEEEEEKEKQQKEEAKEQEEEQKEEAAGEKEKLSKSQGLGIGGTWKVSPHTWTVVGYPVSLQCSVEGIAKTD